MDLEKLKLHEENITRDLLEARKFAAEAQEAAKSTLISLDHQNEILQGAEDTLEANEYILQKSYRTLRGMTWSGMFYNMFVPDKHHLEVNDPSFTVDKEPTNKYDRNTNSISTKTNPINYAHDDWRSIDSNDSQLNEISSAVENLKDASVLISKALYDQNEMIDRIDDKSTIVNDQTLGVTLKAAQLTRTRSSKVLKIGRFQFIEPKSKKFLAVVLEDIVLIAKEDRSTYFDCYCKENNLYGLQNCKTQKFIGSTILATIRASGHVFGKQEELNIDVTSGHETGIFVVCINWGNGGCLKDQNEGKILSNVTSGITDRRNMLMLIPQKIIEPPNPKFEEEM